jgi:hypothetical protein
VKIKGDCAISGPANRHCDHVAQNVGVRIGRPDIPSPFHGNPVDDAIEEERSEQDDARQVAIRRQVRERPDFHGQQHRVFDGLLDEPGRRISRDDQDQRWQHQRERDVPRPDGRRPYRNPGLEVSEAPDHRRKAQQRDERIEPHIGAPAHSTLDIALASRPE